MNLAQDLTIPMPGVVMKDIVCRLQWLVYFLRLAFLQCFYIDFFMSSAVDVSYGTDEIV